MKKENKLLGFIIILGLIISIIITLDATPNYYENTPFTEIRILKERVNIKDSVKSYQHKADCSNLKVNEQILSYELKKDNYKVNTSIKVFKNDILLKENYDNATHIETIITIEDKETQKEEIYIIETTCQQGDLS